MELIRLLGREYGLSMCIIFLFGFITQPRYVVNQVTAGDYDCPRKVLKFLTDLNAAFRMLNLRNDFLRKKFDSNNTLALKLPLLCPTQTSQQWIALRSPSTFF